MLFDARAALARAGLLDDLAATGEVSRGAVPTLSALQ